MQPNTKSKRPPPRFRAPRGRWVTYERSYLITVGLAFSSVAAFLAKGGFEAMTGGKVLAIGATLLLGVCLMVLGFGARREAIEKWADTFSRHEAAILLMVVAFPVYLVLSVFDRRD